MTKASENLPVPNSSIINRIVQINDGASRKHKLLSSWGTVRHQAICKRKHTRISASGEETHIPLVPAIREPPVAVSMPSGTVCPPRTHSGHTGTTAEDVCPMAVSKVTWNPLFRQGSPSPGRMNTVPYFALRQRE